MPRESQGPKPDGQAPHTPGWGRSLARSFSARSGRSLFSCGAPTCGPESILVGPGKSPQLAQTMIIQILPRSKHADAGCCGGPQKPPGCDRSDVSGRKIRKARRTNPANGNNPARLTDRQTGCGNLDSKS